MKRFISILLLTPGPAVCATTFGRIEVSSTQAMICYQTNQTGYGAWRVSKGSSFSSNIPDLTDNGNTDSRVGSVVQGGYRCFVIGTAKGNDLLQPDTTYWAGVTVGADSEISEVFHTRTTPNGMGASSPLPFNNAKFQNVDSATVNWSDKSVGVNDFSSGLLGFRLTGPSPDEAGDASDFEGSAAFGSIAIDLAGTNKCSPGSSLGANGSSYSNCSGGATDKYFLPIPQSAYNDFTQRSWDDLLLTVYCGNASGTVTYSAYLSKDSGQTQSGSIAPVSASCPGGSDTLVSTLPSSVPQPFMGGWGVDQTNVPLMKSLMVSSGNVTISSSTVTLQSPSTFQNYFNDTWAAGTRIFISGSSSMTGIPCPNNICTISAVTSPTTLTITQSCSGSCPTNASYSSLAFGVVVYRSASGGSSDASFGFRSVRSSVPFKGVNGVQSRFNQNTVSVTKGPCKTTGPHTGQALNENGSWVSCSGPITFGSALQGNLWTDGVTAIWLWIPYNADGSPRAENRLMSLGNKQAISPSMHLAGDNFMFNVGVILNQGTFDDTDPNTIYAQVRNSSSYPSDGTVNWLFKLTYDPTINSGACSGYLPYLPNANTGGYSDANQNPLDDCFGYFNLTPHSATPKRTLRDQIVLGYTTGLNYAGNTVSTAHPTFDFGWIIPTSTGLSTSFTYQSGIACVPWGVGDGLSGVAGFDGSGKLVFVQDNWSQGQGRWGATHGECTTRAGNYEQGTQNQQQFSNNNQVFSSPHTSQIDAINRVDPPGSPVWQTGSSTALSLSNSPPDTTLCPTLPSPYTFFTGTRNCLLVRFKNPLCNIHSSTSYMFPSGKLEAAEYPCTDPTFGNNFSSWSMLQLVQPGDWMVYGSNNTPDSQTEHLAVMSVSYDSAGKMTMTLLRWTGQNLLAPVIGGCDDISTTHDLSANWWLFATPTGAGGGLNSFGGCGNGSASWWRNMSAYTNVVGYGNPTQSATHGAFGYGPTNPNYSIFNLGYTGQFNQALSSVILGAPSNFTTSNPTFARSDSDTSSSIQDYPSITAGQNTSRSLAHANDFRAENPLSGGPDEDPNSRIGSDFTFSLVSGATHTYQITDNVTSGTVNVKLVPEFGRGNKLYRDISGPGTSATEMPLDTFCYAHKTDECIVGSSVGQMFVSSSKWPTGTGRCHTNQTMQNLPCVMTQAPYDSQITEFDLSAGPDAYGVYSRKFGFAGGLPGSHYDFSNFTKTPDGKWFIGTVVNGVRRDYWALVHPRWPEVDSVDRTTFVKIPVTGVAPVGSAYIRARFGYREFYDNGTSNLGLFHCTPYAVDCSTDIPSGAPTDPFSFVNETPTRVSATPGSASTISIPALPGRIVYYVLEWLNSGGTVISSAPTEVEVVP